YDVNVRDDHADSSNQFQKIEHGIGRKLLGADVVRYFFAGVGNHGAGRDVVIEDAGGLGGNGHEVLSLLRVHGMIHGVGGGNGSDQDEHDQTHSLLAIVG